MILANPKETTNTNRKANRRAGGLGYLQVKILRYALSVAETFTPGDIVVYYKLDRRYHRRIHDAIKRLEKRRILVKIDRGIYRLNQHIDLSVEDLQALKSGVRKEKDFAGFNCFDYLDGFDCLDCGVVRLHVIGARRLLDLLFCLSFLRYISVGALKYLQQYMKLLFPWRVLRDVEFRAKRLAQSIVASGEFILGAHGRYGVGCNRELLPISLADYLLFREVCVDLLVPRGLVVPKMHIKFYTGRSPYAGSCGEGVGGGVSLS
jgi:hypothetical protein